MVNKITLSISKELKEKLEEKIKETNFKSISEYITFVLGQITSEIKTERQAYAEEEMDTINASIFNEEGKDNVRDTERQGYTEEEEEDLKKNLEDSGYI